MMASSFHHLHESQYTYQNPIPIIWNDKTGDEEAGHLSSGRNISCHFANFWNRHLSRPIIHLNKGSDYKTNIFLWKKAQASMGGSCSLYYRTIHQGCLDSLLHCLNKFPAQAIGPWEKSREYGTRSLCLENKN